MPRKPLALFLVLAAALALSAGPLFAATKRDRIVAQVNRSVITLSELEARLALLAPAQKAVLEAGGKTPQEMVLNMMIEEELVNQAAAAYEIRVEESEITEAVNSVMKENGLTEAQFAQALRQNGMTPQLFRMQIRQQILSQKLIGASVVSRMVVTETEVTDFLSGKLPEGLTAVMSESGVSDYDGVRMIYLDATPKTAQQVMQKAAQIKAEIEGGLPFAEAATKYSQGPGADKGGDPGGMIVGELHPELQAVAKKLTPGKVSAPLYAGNVVLLITVLPSQRPAAQPPAQTGRRGRGKAPQFTAEERQNARRQLEQMKIRGKLDSFMDTLKQKAVIKTML